MIKNKLKTESTNSLNISLKKKKNCPSLSLLCDVEIR